MWYWSIPAPAIYCIERGNILPGRLAEVKKHYTHCTLTFVVRETHPTHRTEASAVREAHRTHYTVASAVRARHRSHRTGASAVRARHRTHRTGASADCGMHRAHRTGGLAVREMHRTHRTFTPVDRTLASVRISLKYFLFKRDFFMKKCLQTCQCPSGFMSCKIYSL